MMTSHSEEERDTYLSGYVARLRHELDTALAECARLRQERDAFEALALADESYKAKLAAANAASDRVVASWKAEELDWIAERKALVALLRTRPQRGVRSYEKDEAWERDVIAHLDGAAPAATRTEGEQRVLEAARAYAIESMPSHGLKRALLDAARALRRELTR